MAAVTSFVVDEEDLEALQDDGDTASIRVAFDAANGCKRLEQRVIRFGPGRSAQRKLAGQQEVLYIVLSGELPLRRPSGPEADHAQRKLAGQQEVLYIVDGRG